MQKISAVIFLFAWFSSLFSYEYRFAIAAKFRDEAPYLKEWVDYHRCAGTDHFWLYDDGSTDNWREVLAPYMEEGLVEVIVLEPSTDTASHRVLQIDAYRDALWKGFNKTPWLALIDLDEFILPMKTASIPECLKTYFQKAHAVYVNWRCFGTGGIYLSREESLLFNLTSCSFTSHPHNEIGKTIIRPEFADLQTMWNAHLCGLIEGGRYFNGDGKDTECQVNRHYPDFHGDGKSHADLIRINHYIMRDENYFHNVRLARAREVYAGYSQKDIPLLLEHNQAFSLTKNLSIVNYINKYHLDFFKNRK